MRESSLIFWFLHCFAQQFEYLYPSILGSCEPHSLLHIFCDLANADCQWGIVFPWNMQDPDSRHIEKGCMHCHKWQFQEVVQILSRQRLLIWNLWWLHISSKCSLNTLLNNIQNRKEWLWDVSNFGENLKKDRNVLL